MTYIWYNHTNLVVPHSHLVIIVNKCAEVEEMEHKENQVTSMPIKNLHAEQWGHKNCASTSEGKKLSTS